MQECLNLNTTAVRQAIRMILQDHLPQYHDLGLKEIVVFNNCRILVRRITVYTYDKHFRYSHKIQHAYALYRFLKSFEEVVLEKKANDKVQLTGG